MENLDRKAPATKGDMADLETRLLERLAESEAGLLKRLADSETGLLKRLAESETRLREQLLESETRLLERLLESIQDAETRTIRAFYNYAETNQKRLLLVEGTEANVLSRLITVETRLMEIERRLNMPPPL